jgi:hypothetical protein
MKSTPKVPKLIQLRRKLNSMITEAQQKLIAASDEPYSIEAQRHVGYAAGERDALDKFRTYIRTATRLLNETPAKKIARSFRLAEAKARRRRVARRQEKKSRQIYGPDDLDWMDS